MAEADWADCYQLRIKDRDLTAMDAARLVLGHFPRWVRVLMAIRNTVVAPFGIKSSTAHSPAEMEMVGVFPVVSQSVHQVVLGFDDRHLDFRAVIDVHNDGGEKLVSVMTLVRRKNLFGKLYLPAIIPFHKLITLAMITNLNR
ncbi:DUF2867 domain-containing protein [Phyllobacterium calauticae]|uniref:DUF2867 domain-containing protein n=1 Tax=Phyllobacterium calauticae TaxID=2817027 RepID=UPI001CBF369D|nr:DUF2867 domain-containing protein [Phyllobacterium calauticae]